MMGRSPDFIGLGAQRTGTSWIYACLYEHPQICIPIKEIHFFSRERHWSKGYEWYESRFAACPPEALAGEFSTSYLPDPDAAVRMHQRYPGVKLIVSLRNPVDRAYSNYLNLIKAGQVNPAMSFKDALDEHPEFVEQGYYATWLSRYLQFFSREQILVLIYEDISVSPLSFIAAIYQFIGVEPSFVPSMAHTRVNVGRVPRVVFWDRLLTRGSDILKAARMERLWWLAKKAGVGDKLRSVNTRHSESAGKLDPSQRETLYRLFEGEVTKLEGLIGRSLKEWRE